MTQHAPRTRVPLTLVPADEGSRAALLLAISTCCEAICPRLGRVRPSTDRHTYPSGSAINETTDSAVGWESPSGLGNSKMASAENPRSHERTYMCRVRTETRSLWSFHQKALSSEYLSRGKSLEVNYDNPLLKRKQEKKF